MMSPRKPMADRILKVKVATDLPVDLLSQLDGFCRRTGLKKCDVFELSLRKWLAAEYEKEAARG